MLYLWCIAGRSSKCITYQIHQLRMPRKVTINEYCSLSLDTLYFINVNLCLRFPNCRCSYIFQNRSHQYSQNFVAVEFVFNWQDDITPSLYYAVKNFAILHGYPFYMYIPSQLIINGIAKLAIFHPNTNGFLMNGTFYFLMNAWYACVIQILFSYFLMNSIYISYMYRSYFLMNGMHVLYRYYFLMNGIHQLAICRSYFLMNAWYMQLYTLAICYLAIYMGSLGYG